MTTRNSRPVTRFNTLFWNMLAALAGAMSLSGLLVFAIAFGLRYPSQISPILQGPFGDDRASYAADMARIAGVHGLSQWLSKQSSADGGGLRTYAVDSNGRNLIDPQPPAAIVALARSELEKSPSASGIKRINVEGKHLLVFSAKPQATFIAESRRYFFGPRPSRFWINCFISLTVAALCAFWLAWWISRPVRKLEKAMDQAASGDLSVRISGTLSHSSYEFQQLSIRFDRMTETIEQLLERQQNLFHSVSHELRSPLARMNCAIELARRSPELTPKMLDHIEGDVRKLDRLVGDLLTYTRLKASVPDSDDVIEFDLCDLLAELTDNARIEATSHGLAITCDLPQSEILIKGNPQVLAHAVENVVRNALRFSPTGGSVRIKAWLAKERLVQILVEDDGPGMNPGEIPRMFEPFTRGSNQSTGSGYGLGLAIAKQAITQMGGTLSAKNKKPHGLAMTFTLPTNL